MKTRKEQVEELAKAIYATGVALDGTDYAFGVYDNDDHFHRMANALIAANIGDVTGYKHRAEVAERAVATVCEEVLHARYPAESVTVSVVEAFIQRTLKEAEKELAEGKR